MPKSPAVLVVGSNMRDMVVRSAALPRPGETLLGGEFFTGQGGKGANQAVTAARAGGDVTFVGRVGNDSLGRDAVAALKRDGIDCRHVVVDPKRPSGVALILVGGAGENSIAVAPGANAALSAADVKAASRAFQRAAVLLVQLEIPVPTVACAIRLGRRAGARVILNPAPAAPLPAALLRGVDIFTPNESEAAAFVGHAVDSLRSVARAAAALRTLGPPVVIVTLGARGAWVQDGSGGRLLPAIAVKAVDTTGAGDVFSGALAVGLAEGRPLDDAVRFGQAAAAISVTRPGTQSSVPSRAEIDALLRKVARHPGLASRSE
ncbi:MAG TPA: ribokinase [Opitutaceae bacterium]|jgi:ribokinase|nr:ribokinase [Opitutaceae bacterium]